MNYLGREVDASAFEQIKVLDHGFVRFVDSMGTDGTIIEAARMSTDKGFQGWGPKCSRCGLNAEAIISNDSCHGELHDFKPGDEKLLEYLYSHAHHTPFEMCELAIEVQAPIFVFREWHRHRTQSFNEMSARYVQMPNLHYLPEVERFAPKQTGNKQESSDKPYFAESDLRLCRENAGFEQTEVYENYEYMLDQGVPREVARLNTPVSRYSKMRAKTDLRNWLGFLKLRMDKAAQFEIRMYAEAVASIVKALWPRTYALFEEYDLHGVRLSATEKAKVLETCNHGCPLGAEIKSKLESK